MSKRNFRNYVDRIALYRWAALIMFPPLIRGVVVVITGDPVIHNGWRVMFWFGWIVLFAAVVQDSWTVYSEKRKMHQAINKAIDRSERERQEEV